jgi:hypothetical protein
MNKLIKIWLFFSVLLLTFSCISTPPFDQAEYSRAISLKIEALSLLKNTTNDFQLNQEEVATIQKEMQFMLEYAKYKPNNQECITLWERMNDPMGEFLGNILKEWEIRGAFSEAFAEGLSDIVSARFDDIIELLGKRIKK